MLSAPKQLPVRPLLSHSPTSSAKKPWRLSSPSYNNIRHDGLIETEGRDFFFPIILLNQGQSLLVTFILYSTLSTPSPLLADPPALRPSPRMAAPRLFRPAARLLSPRISSASLRPAFQRSACSPSILRLRTYATESSTKEVTVRDALNEAMSEEMESNPKVFLLGEEVAQYNGAYAFVSLLFSFSFLASHFFLQWYSEGCIV